PISLMPRHNRPTLTVQEAANKLQVNAEESSDDLANPPKVEEKLGAVPHGLSTDSEVAQSEAESISRKTLRSSAEKFEFQAEILLRTLERLLNLALQEQELLESLVEADTRRQERAKKMEEKKVYLQLYEAMEALVKIDLETNKIMDFIKFDVGNMVM
ncbi:hypothetical protein ACJX0J_034110, partial [Zea mays]